MIVHYRITGILRTWRIFVEVVTRKKSLKKVSIDGADIDQLHLKIFKMIIFYIIKNPILRIFQYFL